MNPIAPVVDGNTAENADDPNTFSEVNGNRFSLQNGTEWVKDIHSIPIDDLDYLLWGSSPLSPSDSYVSENILVCLDSKHESIEVNPLQDNAVAFAPHTTVPDIITTTDLTGLELLPTRGAIPTSTTFFDGGCFVANCRFMSNGNRFERG